MKQKQFNRKVIFFTVITVFTGLQLFSQTTWSIKGNANIASGTNYLGTKDPNDLVFRTNAVEHGRLSGTDGSWHFGSSSDYAQIDTIGRLRFFGSGKYVVSGNRYVFQYSVNNSYGLYFKSSPLQYQFLNKDASPVFSVDATTGAGSFSGTLTVGAYTFPATDGTSGQTLATDGSGKVSWSDGTSWSLTGNRGTNDTKSFIGTKDAKALVLKTSNTERLSIAAAGDFTFNAGQIYLRQADGFVGIGTTTPFAKLDIGDPVDNTAIRFSKSGVNYGALFAKTSTTSGVETINSSNAGAGSGISASSVNGIGVSGYSSNYFGIYGSTGGTQANGDYAGYFSGAINVTGGYYANSDQNLKKNIQDLTSAIDLIKQLKPKHYEFKSDGDYKLMNLPQGEHYGLIAQDVEKVLPELVGNVRFETRLAIPHPTEEDLKNSRTLYYKSLNYTELIPILVKGIQEQQSVIEKQQEQIDRLETMMETMMSNTNVINSPQSTQAYLQQNLPNPFSQNTVVRCNVPQSSGQAQLVVYSNDGKPLKTYSLGNKGMNEVTINAGTLASGIYEYALLIEGKIVDSKKMVITK